MKIELFYFSGTEMTLKVVNELDKALKNQNDNLQITSIQKPFTMPQNFNDVDMLGIAFPVHAFGAPHIVLSFAKQLPKACLPAFIICSAADKHKINSACFDNVCAILKQTGYHVFLTQLFQMPCNFMTKHSEKEVQVILEQMQLEVKKLALQVSLQTHSNLKSSAYSRFFMRIGKAEHFGAKMIGKCFYTTKACNQCLACLVACPMQNITLKANKVHFGSNCILCMKCLYFCPQDALKIRWPFKFIKFDSFYTF